MGENRKGNMLYAVLGVITLVAAIIGATFAYFSASATADGKIEGGTNDVGASLDLSVERVLFVVGESDNYNNLVPAKIELSNTGVEKAVNSKCIANNYMGCHLYKITATSDQDLPAANLLLYSFSTTEVTDTGAWKFIVFTGTETDSESTTIYTISNLVTGATAQNFKDSTAINTESEKGFNIHNSGMEANKSLTYYLLVYLEDNDKIQNPDSEDTQNAQYKATGTYSGSVALNAAGGKVVANFTASLD